MVNNTVLNLMFPIMFGCNLASLKARSLCCSSPLQTVTLMRLPPFFSNFPASCICMPNVLLTACKHLCAGAASSPRDHASSTTFLSKSLSRLPWPKYLLPRRDFVHNAVFFKMSVVFFFLAHGNLRMQLLITFKIPFPLPTSFFSFRGNNC